MNLSGSLLDRMIRVVGGVHWCILRYPDEQNDFKFLAPTQTRSVFGSAVPSTSFRNKMRGEHRVNLLRGPYYRVDRAGIISNACA